MSSSFRFGLFDDKKRRDSANAQAGITRRKTAGDIAALRIAPFADAEIASLEPTQSPEERGIARILALPAEESVPVAASAPVVQGKTLNADGTERGFVPVAGNAPVDAPDALPATGPASQDAVSGDRGGAFQMATKDGRVSWGGGGAAPGSAQKFTPAQTKSLLSSLKANQPIYLDELPRSGVRKVIEGEYAGPGGGTDVLGVPNGTDRSADMVYNEIGTVPTRDQSAAERRYEGMQVEQAEGQQERIDAARAMPPYRPDVEQLLLQQQVAAAQARLQFIQQYGVEPTPENVKVIAETQKAMQEDEDYQNALQNAAELLASGQYDQASYDRAVTQIQRDWGVRKKAPSGYFVNGKENPLAAMLAQVQ